MSRFFRSGESSSSSESEGDEAESVVESGLPTNSDETDTSLSLDHSALIIGGQSSGGPGLQSSQQWTSHHRDILLHALLERWCLDGGAKDHEDTTHDEHGNQSGAHATYHGLVSQLAPLGVLSTDLADDQHAATRQRYREGLSVLARQHSNAAIPSGVNSIPARYTTLRSLSPVPYRDDLPRPQDQFGLQAPLRYLLEHTGQVKNSTETFTTEISSAPFLSLAHHGMNSGYGQTRYRSDFEELRILGHGGYGIVYHARNRLDNQEYAVKKVPLSAARVHRVRTRGQAEVDDILRELRTLARLHHPKVVRYYHAWIDWAEGVSQGAEFGRSLSDHSAQQEAGADGIQSHLLGRVFTDDEVDGTDVVFEHSDVLELQKSEESGSGHSSETHQLRRVRTRSTTATASDETVETIDREPEVSVSIQSTAEGAQFAQSSFGIFIQMSLHPMTLADLLGNKSKDGESVQHCYHLEPSVSITGAVLEGIEYLHGEGIIHRDIKPANIFLSPSKSRGAKRDCVDFQTCGDCNHNSKMPGTEWDVCIGDFGLAAVASPESESYSDGGAVGTAIYCPTTTNANNSASLDIYALGIVFFELLRKFETKMERHHIIHEMKEGTYPSDFDERIGKGRGVRTRDCIARMLAQNAPAINATELREKLVALVEWTTDG